MTTDQLTDAQVLAELLPEERQEWQRGTPRRTLWWWMRRLALSRIEAREARAGIEARDHYLISCPYCGKRTHGDHSSITTSHVISCADVAIGMARREAREAAAREREACAAIIDAESTQLRADVAGDYISRARHLDALAARIRARGGAA